MPFNLTCTKCGKVLARDLDDEMVNFMTAGYCNDQSCLGKLELMKA